MKKKFVLRIILDILFILSVVIFVWAAIENFQTANANFTIYEIKGGGTGYEYGIKYSIFGIFAILCALFALIFFIFLNFKDISYLCGSLLKEHKENKEATAEARKQQKIEELEKQLNDLKKDE